MRSWLSNPSARAVAKAATSAPAINGGTKTSELLCGWAVLGRRPGTGGFMMLRMDVEEEEAAASRSCWCVVDNTGGSGGGIVIFMRLRLFSSASMTDISISIIKKKNKRMSCFVVRVSDVEKGRVQVLFLNREEMLATQHCVAYD